MKGVDTCIELFDDRIESVLRLLEAKESPVPEQEQTRGSYYRKKEYEIYCENAEKEKYMLQEAIDYLRARTFENGRSYRYNLNGRTYECKVSIKEIK